jgi:hypothetical protein
LKPRVHLVEAQDADGAGRVLKLRQQCITRDNRNAFCARAEDRRQQCGRCFAHHQRPGGRRVAPASGQVRQRRIIGDGGKGCDRRQHPGDQRL